jgi:hypothetical protein
MRLASLGVGADDLDSGQEAEKKEGGSHHKGAGTIPGLEGQEEGKNYGCGLHPRHNYLANSGARNFRHKNCATTSG